MSTPDDSTKPALHQAGLEPFDQRLIWSSTRVLLVTPAKMSFEPFPLWQDMPFLDASEMQRQDND